jgi:hypothetical protein
VSRTKDEHRPSPPSPMYHYTDKAGYDSIQAGIDWRFKAHRPPPRHHRIGAYFTNLGPEAPKAKLAQLFIPSNKRAYVFAFEDEGDLIPLRGGRGGYVFYSPADYAVVRARQLDCGESESVAARMREAKEKQS